MEYLKAVTDGIIYSYETYFDKAERLKCERCKQMQENSQENLCHCINCVTNSYIIDAYYNSMKLDISDENKAKSAKILQTILSHKIQYAIKEIDKCMGYEGMLVEANTFIQNNPSDVDDV